MTSINVIIGIYLEILHRNKMKSLLRIQRIHFVISIYFCIFVSDLHSSDISGVIGIEVPNSRAIISNNNVSFIQSDKIQENHTNFETSNPLPFVIPSYASGILDSKITPIASKVSPSQFLLPPIMVNDFETTIKSVSTLNSNEPERTTVLPPTQQSNYDGDTDDIQNVSTRKPPSFTPSAPNGSFQFNSISMTSPPSKTTTVTTTSETTIASTENSSLFPVRFGETFQETTLTPIYDSGSEPIQLDDDILDDILGYQKPGYAVRPDGSIDPNALPPEFIQYATTTKVTTELPTTTVTFPISHTSSPITTTTGKLIATPNVNITHNIWLQQGSPFRKTTPFSKHNSKPIISSTTSNQFATKTDFSLETTTQTFSEGLAQFPIGSPFNSQAQSVSETTSGSQKQNNDLPINGTSPEPFNIMETTTTQNTIISRIDNNNDNITVNKIQIPSSDLLPPPQENEQSLKNSPTTQTNTSSIEKFSTKLTTFSSTIPTVPIKTVVQPTSNIQQQYEPLAITMPNTDLLPPIIVNAKVDTMTNEAKPHEFLPHLDLNPFLAPFLGSVQNLNDAQTTEGTTLSLLQTTTNENSKVLPSDPPFSNKKPVEPFNIQTNAHRSTQQQQPFQPNTKYTGSFGAPPGILAPYDNLG